MDMQFSEFSIDSLFSAIVNYLPKYESYQMVGGALGFRGIINFSNGTVFTSDDVRTICSSTDIDDFHSLAKYCAALAVDFSENINSFQD